VSVWGGEGWKSRGSRRPSRCGVDGWHGVDCTVLGIIAHLHASQSDAFGESTPKAGMAPTATCHDPRDGALARASWVPTSLLEVVFVFVSAGVR